MPVYKFFIFILLIGPFFLEGQNAYSTYKDLNKKDLKKFKKADQLLNVQDFSGAHKILNDLLSNDPLFADGYLKNAAIYIEEGDTTSAIINLERALKIAPEYRINSHHALARLYYEKMEIRKAVLRQGQYIEALAAKHKSTEEASFELECFMFAENAIKNPVPFSPIPMPGTINTDSCAEYLPSFTADEQKMIFTRRDENLENLYSSTRNEKGGDWSPAESMSQFNSAVNEGAFNMSADGRTIIFTRCGPNPALDNYNSCDLYESKFINGNWTFPVSITAINTYAWESQPCISENGQTLFFSSNRSGGYGKSDIYISHRTEQGAWSVPINAGPVINSGGSEASPFFHPDGASLYFMSDGHIGMGNFDLFLSRFEDNVWLSPMNLGYPINTIKQEGAMVVSLDGQTAYFARSDEHADILQFELYTLARPKPVLYVKGIVKDRRTLLPVESIIEIEQWNGEDSLSILTDRSGEFLITLPSDQIYSFTVQKEKYLFFSERFELTGKSGLTDPVYLEILLDEAKGIENSEREEIVLKNVLFESGSSRLKESSFKELTKLVKLLLDNQKLKIEIQGHTDNIGTSEDNLTLSEARAKSVYDFLLDKGIDPGRLRFKGFGEKKPVSPNDTEAGRSQNRRTSFVVIPD
jgi:outer membrane protein OmpA-like peptidoglycan-associated protein